MLSAVGQNMEQYVESVKKGMELFQVKKYRAAAQAYAAAFAAMEGKGLRDDRYNAACAWALAGEKDSAFNQLSKIVIITKYDNYLHMKTDPDLESLHSDQRWSPLLKMVLVNKEKKEEHYNKEVVRILDTVYMDDQYGRLRLEKAEKQYGPGAPEVISLKKNIAHKDSLNLSKVKFILDKYGWPGEEEIGEEGAKTLFLTIQHADLPAQKVYLPLIKQAVRQKKLSASYLPLLEDRMSVREGKEQEYGTQISRDEKTGEYFVCPIRDPENIDQRRAAYGLPPMAEYVKVFGLIWDLREYLKKLPHLPPCSIN